MKITVEYVNKSGQLDLKIVLTTILSHRRSTIVSLETYPPKFIYLLHNSFSLFSLPLNLDS